MLVLIRSLRSHVEADRELPGNVPSFCMQGPLPDLGETTSAGRPSKGGVAPPIKHVHGHAAPRIGSEAGFKPGASSQIPDHEHEASLSRCSLPSNLVVGGGNDGFGGDAASTAPEDSSSPPQILAPGPYRRFSVPEMPDALKGASDSGPLNDVRTDLGDCRRCDLHGGRKNIVFGEGNPHAELVFVGEAPGADEDAQGRPFVGRAGQLLTKIIEAMKLGRQDVYICNILKCRPPGNRNPGATEIAACEPFLVKQLASIRPKVICALGTFATQTLLKSDVAISLLRGRFHRYHDIPLMPTYHPAYLLRNPSQKRQVWEDVQKIMKLLAEGSE